MPRQRISAKYTGENGEHYMGIPARDLTEDEFDALSDDQKATLGASKFYSLRHGADEEAEKAAKRVEHAEPVTPMAAQAVEDMPEPPAPKEAAKK
jgi:hypothetical protein